MKVYIFGTGIIYKRFKHVFENMDILGFFDNDPLKIGSEVDGHLVVSPEKALVLEYDYVIIASIHYLEMRMQLINIGVNPEKIIDKEHRGIFDGLNQTEQYIFPDEGKTSKRILMFSHALDLTGAPVVFCRLAGVLNKMGYNITMVAEKNSMVHHDVLLYHLTQMRISVILVSDYDLIDIHSISVGYDLYWVSTVLLGKIVDALIETGKSVYWWLHETDDIYTSLSKSLIYPKGDNLYVLTGGWMAAESFEKYSGCKVYQNLLYGVPDIVDKFQVRNRNSKIKIGLIAAYSARKGHDILFQAIKKNYDKWFDWVEFFFVGSFPIEKEIEYLSINNIRLLGELEPENVASFYEEIDVLIAPSLYDPMPVVVTEAMLHNKLCLISDKVGQVKYITPMVDGIICEAGNIEDLEEKIDWIISHRDMIEDMGIRAHMIYERDFSMDSFEQHIETLLTETL